MAEIASVPQPALETTSIPSTDSSGLRDGAKRKPGPSLHQVYALPLPIRTFPLPTFYPSNLVSVFHIAYAWLRQVMRPPLAEPALIHRGVWSAATTSVHVTDEESMKALWEQGFYGKGNLSRSQPNWLKREKVRRGAANGHVSEIHTSQRREERIQAKWERARLEQEAIRKTRMEESRQESLASQNALLNSAGATVAQPKPPVGPLELLALPNSSTVPGIVTRRGDDDPELDDLEALPENHPLQRTEAAHASLSSGGSITISDQPLQGCEGSSNTEDATFYSSGSTPRSSPGDSPDGKNLKRVKSVRFSPKVESQTFQLSDPPSPSPYQPATMKSARSLLANGTPKVDGQSEPAATLNGSSAGGFDDIVNKEHLQLTPEEAFFLSFGLGALVVTEPLSGQQLSPMDMFELFRQYSYFPPRTGPDDEDLRPDDDFLIHYVAYHHFRSLGWVPRAGIKFGVDWLLYNRGPVFDHAEFGLVIVPSYSDPEWHLYAKKDQRRTWQWLHSLVRVLSHVVKSLVLVYVDVPGPTAFNAGLERGLPEAFKLYRVREVMVKRWSSNRNR